MVVVVVVVVCFILWALSIKTSIDSLFEISLLAVRFRNGWLCSVSSALILSAHKGFLLLSLSLSLLSPFHWYHSRPLQLHSINGALTILTWQCIFTRFIPSPLYSLGYKRVITILHFSSLQIPLHSHYSCSTSRWTCFHQLFLSGWKMSHAHSHTGSGLFFFILPCNLHEF